MTRGILQIADAVREHPAVLDVLDERARQVKAGYTTEHDDEHGSAEILARAETEALVYRISGARGNLVRAVALALAALEAHDRGQS